MKVCFVSAYPPNKGNLAEYGYYLVNKLIKNNLVNELIVLANYTSNSNRIEKFDKLKIIRCWKNNSFTIPLDVLKALKRENPDLVHFNLHMMSWGKNKISNFLGAITPYLVKVLLRKKVVVTLHNIVEATNLEELGISKNKITLFFASIATKFLLKADKIVVTLERFRRILEKKYKADNVMRILHGTLGRRVKKLRVGGKTILTFGFWRKNKNLPLLIDVFRELSKKDRNVKLIVAGSSHPNFPGYLENLREMYGKMENIIFTGYVPENKLQTLFTSSTVIVLPYATATGTSGVVHLAISYGKPIIVSDLPEIREPMKEENLELILVPKNDKKALRKAIWKVLINENLQRKIARKNLESAKKYSFLNISKEYIKIYKELLYNECKYNNTDIK
jgi:glycosyltransferase involved in cell wall biosynthesis